MIAVLDYYISYHISVTRTACHVTITLHTAYDPRLNLRTSNYRQYHDTSSIPVDPNFARQLYTEQYLARLWTPTRQQSLEHAQPSFKAAWSTCAQNPSSLWFFTQFYRAMARFFGLCLIWQELEDKQLVSRLSYLEQVSKN
jgi:hypothetical protein